MTQRAAHRQLVKVNPKRIVVKESFLDPSQWDKRVVQEDLIDYVSSTRVLKGTPNITVREGQIVLLDGLPFLNAALKATPPLEEITCLIDSQSLDQVGLVPISPSQMLERYPEEEIYEAAETITFHEPLTAEKRQTVEKAVVSFFEEVSGNPEGYGGNYRSLGAFSWNEQRTRLFWTWRRSDKGGRHLLRFQELLKEINSHVAPVRSWNGFSFPD